MDPPDPSSAAATPAVSPLARSPWALDKECPAFGLPLALSVLGLDAAFILAALPWYMPHGRVALLLAVVIFLLHKRRAGVEQLGLGDFSWSEELRFVLRVALVVGAGYLMTTLCMLAVIHGFRLRLELPRDMAEWTLDSALAFLTGSVLLWPLIEEALYRGLLYPPLRRVMIRLWGSPRRGVAAAIVVSTLAFGLLHAAYGVFYAPSHLVGGLVFTWAYEKRGVLITPFVLHAGANLCVFIVNALQLSFPEAFQALITPSSTG